MLVTQQAWEQRNGWSQSTAGTLTDADLVLVFGSGEALRSTAAIAELRSAYPRAEMVGCSTAGEILGAEVRDDSVVATAVAFENTQVKSARVQVADSEHSRAAGRLLAQAFSHEQLIHMFVLSEGLGVNGSELVAGITEVLPTNVQVTGGLAGDGTRFSQTSTVWGDEVRSGMVVAVAFYGNHLRVGDGSLGGWDPFGPERLVTRSQGNVLYELDGRPALDLYKTYLGEHAAGLPGTGLLFPLSIRRSGEDTGIVRTILAVDDAARSITFAGDVPETWYARLMKANFDRLIDGAVGAAESSRAEIGPLAPDLAILISCVGRRMVLKQRVEEEIEGVRSILGDRTAFAGFYSYGEISPFTPSARCELHNQTMTITTMVEV